MSISRARRERKCRARSGTSPSRARGHGGFQVAVGGGQDAHVHGDEFASAQAFHLFFLEQAQDLGLDAQRHVADLVQEHGAAHALFDLADAPGAGAGEGALFIAEEFGLQQGVGDGHAVDDHEGLVRAGAVLPQGARHQLLTGAGLAADEHQGLGGRGAADGLEDVLHGAALAHQGVALGIVFEPLQKPLLKVDGHALARQSPGLQGLVDEPQDVWDVEGLEDVVVGAELGGLDGRLGAAVGGHDDDRQVGHALAHALHGGDAGDAGHAHVHDHEVRGLAGDLVHAGLAGGGGAHLEPVGLQDLAEALAQLGVVVNNQDLSHVFSLRSVPKVSGGGGFNEPGEAGQDLSQTFSRSGSTRTKVAPSLSDGLRWM